ncbi:MAG: thymidine phosphorylase [Candidatus Marinimicrobia bacterium]|nr:thymidine phosphorylase [Candidatus Neomarinimicrobiota bacterium]MBL7010989.1 thymidine phosphorylase [Candidatus Neomarinimicrobiota bacterium]MBL7031413.1 thymidine phosphorylase [Candidatus Neomarinimicrobiota bacterium]
MNPTQLIQLKSEGKTIPRFELASFINAYVDGNIHDDEMTLFLKAIHTHGMTDEETITLTELMLNSGEQIQFSGMDAYIADKHSTGGVGDKVSIVLGPLMAAAGLAIPMLSGRSLGHTGGTTDKLETIPGFQTSLTLNQFKANVETHGLCIMGQTETICPADRKMYALRDVTNTIDSIPLICGSIMSKKIAEGIQGLVLDIKTGNGAFMKTVEDATALGRMLQIVGKAFNVKTDVIYSSMNQPLGRTAGLWCEIAESITALKGEGTKDLMDVVFELGSKLLVQAGITRGETAAVSIQENLIQSGKAYDKFEEMVKAQGGDMSNADQLHQPKFELIVSAKTSGYIESMDTLNIGWAGVELGCGRRQKDDILDPTAGIEFTAKIGEKVSKGDPLFRCFNSNENKLNSAINYLQDSTQIGPEKTPHILFFNN